MLSRLGSEGQNRASSNRQCTCSEPHHAVAPASDGIATSLSLTISATCVRPCPASIQRMTGEVWGGRLAVAAAAAAAATATFRAGPGPELETWEVEISSRSRRREGAGVVSSAAPVSAKDLEATGARAESPESAEDLPRSAEKQSSFGEIREILV